MLFFICLATDKVLYGCEDEFVNLGEMGFGKIVNVGMNEILWVWGKKAVIC